MLYMLICSCNTRMHVIFHLLFMCVKYMVYGCRCVWKCLSVCCVQLPLQLLLFNYNSTMTARNFILWMDLPKKKVFCTCKRQIQSIGRYFWFLQCNAMQSHRRCFWSYISWRWWLQTTHSQSRPGLGHSGFSFLFPLPNNTILTFSLYIMYPSAYASSYGKSVDFITRTISDRYFDRRKVFCCLSAAIAICV